MENGTGDARPPRYIVRGKETDWVVTLENAREIDSRIGRQLFAAFLKCFIGADRLLALEQFMMFTVGLKDGASKRRNLRAISVLLSSSLVEVAEGLDALNSAQVTKAMRNASLWEPLNAKRKLWLNDKSFREIRNSLGNHFGETARFQAGLNDLLTAESDLVFAVGDGPLRHDNEYTLPWNALFKAMGLNLDDHRRVLERTQSGYTELPEELWAVWADVLSNAGVPIQHEEQRAPR